MENISVAWPMMQRVEQLVYTSLLSPFSSPSQSVPKMLPIEETVMEVMVAAADIELLHRWMGNMGIGVLKRLGRDELVQNLERGVVGELGVCRGSELDCMTSREPVMTSSLRMITMAFIPSHIK